MTFSLIRGLTASVLSNVSSLKRQSKRLHKHSKEVFGQTFTIEQCQEAIARANGFFKWSDVTDLAGKFSSDKSSPYWTINSRSNLHESVLSALVRVSVDINENHPIVITGDADASLVGVSLWLETISLRKIPGLILIDTDKLTVEDTDIGKAFKSLGKDEEFSRFRVIDTREMNIPFSISTTVKSWVRAIYSTLSEDEANNFETNGGIALLESIAEAYVIANGYGRDIDEDVSFSVIKLASSLMLYPEYQDLLLRNLENQNTINVESLKRDIKKYLEIIPQSALDEACKNIALVAQRRTDLGPIIWEESKYTPTVVLFSRKNIETEIIAAAVHSMYFWRYVSQRDIRPILYFSDTGADTIPRMLTSGANSIVVDASLTSNSVAMESFIMKQALFAKTDDGYLSFSGRKAEFKPK